MPGGISARAGSSAYEPVVVADGSLLAVGRGATFSEVGCGGAGSDAVHAASEKRSDATVTPAAPTWGLPTVIFRPSRPGSGSLRVVVVALVGDGVLGFFEELAEAVSNCQVLVCHERWRRDV